MKFNEVPQKIESSAKLLAIAFTAFLASCNSVPNQETLKKVLNENPQIEHLNAEELQKIDSVKTLLLDQKFLKQIGNWVEVESSNYNKDITDEFGIREKYSGNNSTTFSSSKETEGAVKLKHDKYKENETSSKNREIIYMHTGDDKETTYQVTPDGYISVEEHDISYGVFKKGGEAIGGSTSECAIVDPETGVVIDVWSRQSDFSNPTFTYTLNKEGEIDGSKDIAKKGHAFISNKTVSFLDAYYKMQQKKHK